MYISTIHLDEMLSEIDPEENRALYNLVQGLKDVAEGCSFALSGIDSRLDGIELRLTDLEQINL